jgi:hypothetical protein
VYYPIKAQRDATYKKEVEDCFEPVLNIHTSLSSTLTPPKFFLLLFNSVAKNNYSYVEKYWRSVCPFLLPLQSYAFACIF